ncbi:MAG: hypothetical protein COC24_013270 [Alphaproteobacteria bacterium]|nr:hypothetical protein [Alphaproteobacteria bacterium]
MGNPSYENDNKLAVERLLADYWTHGKLIVAVDFDNTIHDFHNQTLNFSGVIDCIIRCLSNQFEVYMFTASNDVTTINRTWSRIFGALPTINESSLDATFNSRKPYYSILLDDRAGLPSALQQLNAVLDEIEKDN